MEQQEIIHNLAQSFDYHFKGDARAARFITLKAPSVAILGAVGKLKSGFMRAVVNADRGSDRKVSDEQREAAQKRVKEQGFTGPEILMMLSSSAEVDYAEYLAVAKCAFSARGVALVDGEQELTVGLIDKMGIDDFEAMLGEYLRVFIVASALKAMEG